MKLHICQKLAFTLIITSIVSVFIVVPTETQATTSISKDITVSYVPQTTLPAPVPIAPRYGSFVSAQTPRLQWNASQDAATYRIQVAENSGFYELTTDQTGITTLYYDITTLKPDSYYFWRVGAQDSTGNSSIWSPCSYFKTILNPHPDRLVSLTATPVSSSQISLSWQDASINEIRFIIERKTGRSSYFPITTLGANETSYTDIKLTPDTLYYYRVKADVITGDSPYSNEASATTLPAPPSAPDLSSPGDGYIVSTVTPKMQWNTSEDVVTFSLQIATNKEFLNPIINEKGINTPFYVVPSDILKLNSSYYWRVNAVDSKGITSDWSPYRHFTILPDPLHQRH